MAAVAVTVVQVGQYLCMHLPYVFKLCMHLCTQLLLCAGIHHVSSIHKQHNLLLNTQVMYVTQCYMPKFHTWFSSKNFVF